MANLHSSSDFRVNPFKVLRLVLVLVGLLLVVFLERRSKKYSSTTLPASSCPPCSCDCISEPTLSLPLEAIDSSLADCGKDDPETNKEMTKDIVALLKEELALHENVTSDSFKRTNALIMGAKKTSSHYQKEAEKCNAGMETCEEAREKAEVSLTAERKLTALWMSRAHEYGWKEDTNDNL
ncbi:hypothetical protein BUALT_Bualt01G0122500 [Buddleja alternifolia]|uniref:Uncharacterized protein n=1 Tax=Buddleja alternifolia TaxID=168488 RepID=A0AAV6YF27_9LAMI|nr:hypothetical protein BUALT_Bualt01G0122500 [Buddleja alternifolia]